MARSVGIGFQDFEQMITTNNYYIDKTSFIKEWWEYNDVVTLITRPRRFGKTLNLDMVEHFFSVNYSGSNLFCNLSIWQEEKYRKLQGTYPIISLSFANVKETSFLNTKKKICQIIEKLYNKYDFLLECDCLNEKEKEIYQKISANMEDYLATDSLNALSDYLMRYYGKKVIILLDEYDTPLQEAYVSGYWPELTSLIRMMFHSTFKTNDYLYRAVMTGITRVSKESVFSDLNNPEVITTTSEKYCTAFGFTEEEVRSSLEQYGLADTMDKVRYWYDGFCFGSRTDIYNPWSITKYLDAEKFETYWANTSSNNLISKLIQESATDVKIAMEDLIEGKSIETSIDEEIVFDRLDGSFEAIFSLLLASGYLKVTHVSEADDDGTMIYRLSLTNLEVRKSFRKMIQGWFQISSARYNDFIKALLENNVGYMNQYMNKMALATFSFFDNGNHSSRQAEPERFYHSFVLGLIADAKLEYTITSNRESGLGRYDVIMEPNDQNRDAYVFEFKVKDPSSEASLEETVENALAQIAEKEYDTTLIAKGFPKERIRHYGFAFEGKRVLISS